MNNLALDPALHPLNQNRLQVPLSVKQLLVYLAAITIFGKGPTYIGIPPIFWGEVTLMICVFWLLGSLGTRIPGRMLSLPSLLVATYVLFGFIRMLPCLPEWGFLALRDSAIWYYGLFFFIGLLITNYTSVADWMWKKLCWIWILAIVWDVASGLPGSPLIDWSPRGPTMIPILSGSTSETLQHMSMGAILLLLGLPRRHATGIGLLVIITMICTSFYFLLIGQGRAVKIAVLVGLAIGLIASVGARRNVWPISRWLSIAYIIFFLAAIYAVILGPEGLNEMAYRSFGVSRLEAINPSDPKDTANWRLQWWNNIRDELHRESPLWGLGMGINLKKFNPFTVQEVRETDPVRSPHNFNMTVLARLGYIGIGLWIAILLTGLGMIFVRVRLGGYFDGNFQFRHYTIERAKEMTFWLIFITATYINASFGVLMEGPVLGVWFWFALGFATGRSRSPEGADLPSPRLPLP